MANTMDKLREIAGSIRNFADVAEHCDITRICNTIPAMRVLADELDAILRESEAQGDAGAVEEWLDRDWPLWRNDPDHPTVQRIRRAWDAAQASQAALAARATPRTEPAEAQGDAGAVSVPLHRDITRDPERITLHLEFMEAGIVQIVGDSAAISQVVKLLRASRSGYLIRLGWTPPAGDGAAPRAEPATCEKCGRPEDDTAHKYGSSYEYSTGSVFHEFKPAERRGAVGADDSITLTDVASVLGEIAEGFDGGEYAITDETRRVLIDFAHGIPEHPLFNAVGHYFAQNPVPGGAPQPTHSKGAAR